MSWGIGEREVRLSSFVLTPLDKDIHPSKNLSVNPAALFTESFALSSHSMAASCVQSSDGLL